MTLLSKSTFTRPAANVATALFFIFIIIQLLVAAGLLPVTILWGGRQTELTPALRLSGVGAAVILSAFIYIIRYRAGLLGRTPMPRSIRILSWVVTAYMVLNTLGNFASVNNVEKLLFGPLTIVLAVMCLIVSLSNLNKE